LIEEIRAGVNGGVGNAEVALIKNIEHIGAKLNADGLADAGVFDNAEINISDAVSPQNISSRVADALSGR